MQIAYWLALCALVIVTTFWGTAPMIRTVLTMLAVGLLSLFLAGRMDWTGEEYALAMMAADAAGAAVVLIHPAGKAQSMIGLTFLLQMGIYAGRLLNGANADINAYWWGLSILAIMQLVVAGGWWFYERFHRNGHVRRVGPLAPAEDIQSLDGG